MTIINSSSFVNFSTYASIDQLSQLSGGSVSISSSSLTAISSGFEAAGAPSLAQAFAGLPEMVMPRPPFSRIPHRHAHHALGNFMHGMRPFAFPGSGGFGQFQMLQQMFDVIGRALQQMGAMQMARTGAGAAGIAGGANGAGSMFAKAGGGLQTAPEFVGSNSTTTVNITVTTLTVDVESKPIPVQPPPPPPKPEPPVPPPPPPPPPPQPKPEPPPQPPRPVFGRGDGDGDGDGDPLAFDINGDGVKTSNRSVLFDLDGDGKKENIRDVNDGVLAINGGKDGKDLFGNYTDLDGDGKADGYKNGFEALKALATKEGLVGGADMKLDAEDIAKLEEKYGLTMKDGYNGAAKNLSERGITEIDLGSGPAGDIDWQGDWGIQKQEGAKFKMGNVEREYADIWHQM